MSEVSPGPEEAAPEEDAGKLRRLTDAEFAEIRELYELGTAGLTDLAEQYGVSRQTLSRRFKDAGVVKGSRAHEVAAAARKAAAGSPSGSAATLLERFADKREEWTEASRIAAYNDMVLVERLTKKVIQETLAAGRALATADDEFKAIERIKKILIETGRHKLTDVLRADEVVDEDNLPSIIIEDLTDEMILEHHKQIGALPEDATLDDLVGESDEIEVGD